MPTAPQPTRTPEARSTLTVAVAGPPLAFRGARNIAPRRGRPTRQPRSRARAPRDAASLGRPSTHPYGRSSAKFKSRDLHSSSALPRLPAFRRTRHCGKRATLLERARRAARVTTGFGDFRANDRFSAAGTARHPRSPELAEAWLVRARHAPRGAYPQLPRPGSADQPRSKRRAQGAGRCKSDALLG